jgi:hypothetical protein
LGKDSTAREVYLTQSKRSLVERVIRTVNEWRVLDGFNADDVDQFESWLDFVVAMVNLKVLADQRRLLEIPDMSHLVLYIATLRKLCCQD